MPRAKSQPIETVPLALQASATALDTGAPLPPTVDYQYAREEWRVLDWPGLVAEFPGLISEKLAEVHTTLVSHERAWRLVRRLFGIRPVMPAMDSVLDDCRIWSRAALLEDLQITRAQLGQELNAVRGLLSHLLRDDKRAEVEPPKPKLESAERPGELNLDASKLLLEYNITLGDEGDTADRRWFESRVLDYLAVLKVPMARALAVNCLELEWQKHILSKELNNREKCVPGEERWSRLNTLKTKVVEAYNNQFESLMKLCPWAGKLAGHYDFQGVVSDITSGIVEYMDRKETHIVDGMFTGLEILVELRRSVQMPTVRYRAGLVAYVNAARAHLWDRDWNPDEHGLGKHALKVMDHAWAVAAAEVLNQQGQHVPDLQKEGDEGEYEPLVKPQPLPT